jgi:hypothetical protein
LSHAAIIKAKIDNIGARKELIPAGPSVLDFTGRIDGRSRIVIDRS